MNRRQIGAKYEECACKYLEEAGYTILERNFRNRVGEIDIIAKEGEVICFTEVKYRRDNYRGGAAEAVTRSKQQTIRRVAQYYLMKCGLDEWTECRFDVIAIENGQMVHYQNAF